jgi:hypothetical protein
MTNPGIGLGAAQPANPHPQEQAAPIDISHPEQAFQDPKPQTPIFPPPTDPVAQANPYAPTGWRRKQRNEFDLELPSGQMCRVMRLERDDLIRLQLLEYMNTFTPMLMDASMDDATRQNEIRDTIQDNPEALGKMLTAVDKVVLAATIRPRITEDRKKINYGTEQDWADPNFTATVHLDDIDTFERMYIFGAAFGRSMDDLKSIFQQTPGLGSMADVASIQQDAE